MGNEFRARAGLLLLLGGLSAAPAAAQYRDQPGPRERLVLTDRDAYFLLPPELVAAPLVEEISLSPDGRYALARRAIVPDLLRILRSALANSPAEPDLPAALVLWDSQTHQSREVWRSAGGRTTAQPIQWLPGSGVALLVVTQEQAGQRREALLRITGNAGKVEAMASMGPENAGRLDLAVSPVQRLAVLTFVPEAVRAPGRDAPRPGAPPRQPALIVIQESGRAGPPVLLAAGEPMVAWATDGSPLVELRSDGSPNWLALDVRSNRLLPLAQKPALYAPPQRAQPPLRVRLTTLQAREGEVSRRVGLLWLESTRPSSLPRALLSSDSSGGELSPRGDCVAYRSQGAGWVALLARLKPAELAAVEAAARAAEQAQVLNDAKQIGLALIMYAQDYDEQLPPAEGLSSALAPYLPEADMLAAFHYTLGGQRLTEVKNASRTEIGWIAHGEGRAVIYADGSSRWEKSP